MERSKNEERRLLPISDDLRETLKRRLGKRLPGCDYVFHRSGRKIRNFDTAWKKACEAAGLPEKLFHDCRCTVSRNLVRSGAMKITGHKTRSVFDRYNIVTERDLELAVEKLSAYTRKESKKKKVSKLPGSAS